MTTQASSLLMSPPPLEVAGIDGTIADLGRRGVHRDTEADGAAADMLPAHGQVVDLLAPISPLRRVPVQGRSVARVARMLDACAELVDEVGYEALTTTLLAERAGVAIGSIYQFFPDKRAVVQALTLRNLEAYLVRLSSRFTDEHFASWWDGIDAAIDEYVTMHRDVPGFRTLHFGDVVDVHLLDEDRDNNQVIAAALTTLMWRSFGIEPSEVNFSITIAVEIADALIKLAFHRIPSGDPTILAEAKTLIHAYLTDHVRA